MGTEKATTTVSGGKTPAPYHVRARQRSASKVLGLDSPSCPSTPPLRSRITVPFFWEDAPGKPKPREAAASALFFPSAASASPLPDDGGATTRAGGDRDCGAVARPAPLKLPPRLQVAARPEHSFSSPKTVIQGPYVRVGGEKEKPPKPVRRSGSMVSCRMMPGTGGSAFSWRKGTAASARGKKDGHDHDASCCSPAASSSASSSSSSSSSMSYFFDVHSRGSGHCQQDDGREDPEDGNVGAKGSVRITRFRRNRSLPNISTSHLWASIRKGIKQISPWS